VNRTQSVPLYSAIALGILSLSSVAHAEKKGPQKGPQCHRVYSHILGTTKEVCIERSRPEVPAQKREPILYFFHGMAGSAQSWTQDGFSKNLQKLATTHSNFPAMTVVTFETSGLSFHADFDGKSRGKRAYESWFYNELMPDIETKLGRELPRDCRITAGMSMGGMAAVRSALKHPELFTAAAAHVPAIPPFGIYSPDSLWLDYWDHTLIGRIPGYSLLMYSRAVFSNPVLADQSDPVVLADQFPEGVEKPKFWFDVGDRDEFGFDQGFKRFRKVLIERQFPFESHWIRGERHMLYKRRSEKLLQFVSRSLTNCYPQNP
jgi:S-formylglutathione hydrolase FrmB